MTALVCIHEVDLAWERLTRRPNAGVELPQKIPVNQLAPPTCVHHRQSIASRDSPNYLAFSAEQSDPCHHRGNYREKENPNDIDC